ncbi:MAG: hypothetical protein JJU29_08605 [Verrucomicrobia bacterium]|nr:hypothetical protein [Verrucomicrobiota bacterium]MCH8514499.1 hypothetical protein [Kiritimatiellia bacterium]
MHTITINGQTRSFDQELEAWIGHRFREARALGESIILQITLGGDINLNFSCPPIGGGVGGMPKKMTPIRQGVLDYLRSNRLCEGEMTPGLVISFVKKLKQLL